MNLQFTLSEMENVYSEASEYTKQFHEAVDNLDAAVKELAGYWTSEETGTYQQFQSLYIAKRKILVEAYNNMSRFCQKVEEKKLDFKEAADKVNRAAE